MSNARKDSRAMSNRLGQGNKRRCNSTAGDRDSDSFVTRFMASETVEEDDGGRGYIFAACRLYASLRLAVNPKFNATPSFDGVRLSQTTNADEIFLTGFCVSH